jgi:hypothetical protein
VPWNKIKNILPIEKFKKVAEFKMAVQTFFHFKISKMLFSKKKFLLYFLTKKFYATIFFKKFKMADESKWQISLQIFLNALSFFF